MLGTAALFLAVAAAVGILSSRADRREASASDALDQVKSSYLRAMGAGPGAVEVPELANPEAAREIQDEYAAKFREIAEAHAGTVGGALARIDEAELLATLGDNDAAIALLEATAGLLGGNDRLRGIVLQRAAQGHEEAERWAEAAANFAAAGSLGDFPLRYWALLDAARCYARAGDVARAVVLFDQVESEAPEHPVPAHLRSLRRELRGLDAL